MKNNWEVKKFEECIEKVTYTKKVKKKEFLIEGDYPIISQEREYINGYWNNSKDVFKITGPVVAFGDHTKVLKYIDFNFVIGADGLKILQPIKGLDAKFFYYYLNSIELKDLGYARHYRLLKDIKVVVPPLCEQLRIVERIEEAFEAIDQVKENVNKNLQYSTELFEFYLQDAFENPSDGWEKKKLGDVFDIKHGYAFKSEFFSDKGEYVLLTPGNFFEKGGYRDRGDKQKYYIGEIPKNLILNKDDMLIAMTEQAAGLLGSPVIIPESNKFLHNQRLGLIELRENNKVNTKFLFHLFNTRRIRSLIHESASGVKVRHTSPKKVMEIKALFPSLHQQQRIAEKIEELSRETKKLEEIYQKKLANLDELKKSILQKAFNGEF